MPRKKAKSSAPARGTTALGALHNFLVPMRAPACPPPAPETVIRRQAGGAAAGAAASVDFVFRETAPSLSATSGPTKSARPASRRVPECLAEDEGGAAAAGGSMASKVIVCDASDPFGPSVTSGDAEMARRLAAELNGAPTNPNPNTDASDALSDARRAARQISDHLPQPPRRTAWNHSLALLHRECHGRMRRPDVQSLVRTTVQTYHPCRVELHGSQVPGQWPSHGAHGPGASPWTSCAFDADGVLLAATGSDGVVRIFDFDEFADRRRQEQSTPPPGEESLPRPSALAPGVSFSSTASSSSSSSYSSSSPSSTASPHLSVRELQQRGLLLDPIHCIAAGPGVRPVRWNPVRQNEVAVAFVARPPICIYDLGYVRQRGAKRRRGVRRVSKGFKEIEMEKERRVWGGRFVGEKGWTVYLLERKGETGWTVHGTQNPSSTVVVEKRKRERARARDREKVC